MGIVVSDTSPIRALACISLLDLLPRLFKDIWVPPAVVLELRRASLFLPPAFRVHAPLDAPLFDRLKRTLDPGESEAIALAIEIGAEAVLIDEADGRAVATALGLKPRGVLGILVDAKKLGLIPEVAPLIVQLRDRIQFRMSSELIRDILHASNEPAIG